MNFVTCIATSLDKRASKLPSKPEAYLPNQGWGAERESDWNAADDLLRQARNYLLAISLQKKAIHHHLPAMHNFRLFRTVPLPQ
jgi:hypothetical protein